MDIPETTLETYRNYMIQYDYPNILKMDNKDIERIFHKDNRTNFLCWALTKINPAYEVRFERYKALRKLESALADTLYTNGCCLTSQKNDFVFGKLNMNEEIKIFSRIFTLLGLMCMEIDRENISPQISTVMYNLQHPDTGFLKKIFVSDNLFDEKTKTISTEEHLKKFQQYDDENNAIERQLLETENELEALKKQFIHSSETVVVLPNDELEDISNKVSAVMSNLTNDFPEYTGHFLKLPEKVVNENLGSMVKSCSDNIDYTKKILDNKNYLNNLKTSNKERNGSTVSEFVVDNYILSEEILS